MDKTIRVSEDTWDWLKQEAHRRRCTMGQLLESFRGMANMPPDERAQLLGRQMATQPNVQPFREPSFAQIYQALKERTVEPDEFSQAPPRKQR